jgi:hypothetical protein
MKFLYLIIVASICATLFSSCSKEEGEGGTSKIKGKLYVKDYDSQFNNIIDEYYLYDEFVYIIYGDDEVYSDRFKTHYDGTYQFEYLRKGNYKLFAYSKDTSQVYPEKIIPIITEVEISENYQTVEVEDIVIFN